MSRQRDSGSGAAGVAAKSLWLVLVLCFRNSFVLTVDMKLGISERVAVPRASFSGGSGEDPRCPWHRSAPLARFGSDWCSAGLSLALLCLFICFPDSVNFSTRQLKKNTPTEQLGPQKEQLSYPPPSPPHSGSVSGQLTRVFGREKHTVSERFTLENLQLVSSIFIFLPSALPAITARACET